jgi:hypothetical protein
MQISVKMSDKLTTRYTKYSRKGNLIAENYCKRVSFWLLERD